MMAGMGSIMYIFIVIGIVCLILSGYKLMHFFGSNAEEGYNILHFTKDSVTINTGFFPPTYKLKDIAEVRFFERSCTRPHQYQQLYRLFAGYKNKRSLGAINLF